MKAQDDSIKLLRERMPHMVPVPWSPFSRVPSHEDYRTWLESNVGVKFIDWDWRYCSVNRNGRDENRMCIFLAEQHAHWATVIALQWG